MKIYSFEPFGYHGQLVEVECDLRRGIPSTDIVGLSDGIVRETTERIRSVFKNQNIAFPSERVLVSASPCDLYKGGSNMSLPLALSIAIESEKIEGDEKFLAVGDLELSGNIIQTDSLISAFLSSCINPADYIFIVSPKYKEYFEKKNVSFILAYSLSDTLEKIRTRQWQKGKETKEEEKVFSDETMNTTYTLSKKVVKAVLLSASSRLNTFFFGSYGKPTSIISDLITDLTPLPRGEEKTQSEKIYSCANYFSHTDRPNVRIPHQTASIEGICGGGKDIRPGEVALAHGGSLILEQTAEFRSSVLSMLRVPVNHHSITLSRAGRSTVYPTDFNFYCFSPLCPCGNFGSKEKVCLCSERSIDNYQLKLSSQIRDSHLIINREEEDETETYEISDLRQKAEKILSFQKGRKLNGRMETAEIKGGYLSEDFDEKLVSDLYATEREEKYLYQTLLSIANLNGREKIENSDVEEYKEIRKGTEEFLCVDKKAIAC